MEPITPVIPKYPFEPFITFAANQPPYKPLPAWRSEDGTVVSRWRLSWTERLRILFFGDLWLTQLTFNNRLQPVKLTVECPVGEREPVMEDKAAPPIATGPLTKERWLD